MKVTALVLAGSRGGIDPVAEAEGVAHKALALVAGKPILVRVLEALREAGIERIAVATNAPAVRSLALTLGAEVIEAAAGPSASVAKAFGQLNVPLLVTTADHALLCAEWVRDFLADVPGDADAALLLAPRETVERALPGSRRTWLRFADGEWSGCNLFLLATPAAEVAITTWQAVERDRKRPWRIAARLGPGTLVSYLTRRLPLQEAVARLGSRIGISARVVPARDGLAAVDVDTPADLKDARRIAMDQG